MVSFHSPSSRPRTSFHGGAAQPLHILKLPERLVTVHAAANARDGCAAMTRPSDSLERVRIIGPWAHSLLAAFAAGALLFAPVGGAVAHGGHHDHDGGSNNGGSPLGTGPVHGFGSAQNPIVYHASKIPSPVVNAGSLKAPPNPAVRDHRTGSSNGGSPYQRPRHHYPGGHHHGGGRWYPPHPVRDHRSRGGSGQGTGAVGQGRHHLN